MVRRPRHPPDLHQRDVGERLEVLAAWGAVLGVSARAVERACVEQLQAHGEVRYSVAQGL